MDKFSETGAKTQRIHKNSDGIFLVSQKRVNSIEFLQEKKVIAPKEFCLDVNNTLKTERKTVGKGVSRRKNNITASAGELKIVNLKLPLIDRSKMFVNSFSVFNKVPNAAGKKKFRASIFSKNISMRAEKSDKNIRKKINLIVL